MKQIEELLENTRNYAVYHEHVLTIQGCTVTELIARIIIWLDRNPLITVLNVQTQGDCMAHIKYIDTGENHGRS